MKQDSVKERQGQPHEPLFPTRQGQPLTRHAVGKLLTKHAAAAATTCTSLKRKNVTPHSLRHSNAMLLRAKDVDTDICAWLLAESRQ
jgi:site-specific recombinase XerD